MKQTTLRIVLEIVLVVAFFGLILWIPLVRPTLEKFGLLSPAVNPQFLKVSQLSIGDDFVALADNGRTLAEGADNDEEYAFGRAQEAYANFMQGTPATRKAAVLSVIDLYSKTNSPKAKASCINILIQFVTVDRTSDIYNAVFTSNAFKKYNIENDLPASLAGLAKESYGYMPTVIGATFMLLPDEAPLMNFDKKYTLTAAQKKAHADALIAGIPQITAAYNEEISNPKLTVQSRLILPMTYFNYFALMNQAVSTVDTSYRAKAIDAYKTLFRYYEESKGPDGEAPAVLEGRIWEYDIRYAQFLYKIDPEANLDEARSHVKAAVDRVTTNPKLNELGLPIFIKNTTSASSVIQPENMSKMIRLTKIYPPFKDFAKKYGVDIPTE